MKKTLQKVIAVGFVSASAFNPSAVAQIVTIDNTAFTYTQDFSGLGTGNVTWVDGSTLNGIYLISANGGVPTTVNASTGGASSGNAYNMGLSGDADRALGWINTSGTGAAYTGIQFRNMTGLNQLEITYNFTLEQWGNRNTAAQDVTLQYKIQSSNPNGNNLISSGWTALGTGTTPVIGDGNSPFDLNGNNHQFSIAGTITLDINDGQFLTFRLLDVDHASGDAMIGIDSIVIGVVPEPSVYATVLGLVAIAFIWMRRRGRN